jgi:hypothetical protein
MTRGILARLISTGDAWPISGDGIARTNAGIGAGGLIGIVDWEDKDHD